MVCRCDETTVRAGLSDPNEILKLIKRGVEVHAYHNLHAKVYVLGSVAIVGSTNLSASSENNLMEAALETKERRLVRECTHFVQSLCGAAVGPEYAAQLCKIYRPPKSSATRKSRASQYELEQDRIVAVGLHVAEFDENDDRAADSVLSEGKAQITNRRTFELDSFYFSNSSLLKKGTRVLQIIDNGRGCSVYAPGRVLSVRRYRGPKGQSRLAVCVEMPKDVPSLPLAQIGKKVPALRDVSSLRKLSAADSHILGQVWSSRPRR